MTEYGAVETTLGVAVREAQGVALLTLNGPMDAVEDVAQAYAGKLTGVGGIALAGQQVPILVNDVVKATATIGADGSYSVQVTFDKPGNFTVKAKWAGGSGLPPL